MRRGERRHRRVIDQNGNDVPEQPSRLRAVLELIRDRPDDELAHDRPNTGPDDLAGVARMPFTIHRIRMRSLRPVPSLAVTREPQGDALELRPVQTAQLAGSHTVLLEVPDLLGLTPDRERLALRAFELELSERQRVQVDYVARMHAVLDEVGEQLGELHGKLTRSLKIQHSILSLSSRALKTKIGPARRFATPTGDAARIAEAYAEGGTGQVAKLTPELIAEMDARAKAGAS